MTTFAPRYQKRCTLNRAHGWYWTDRPGARYVNAKGNPRYLCPKCAAEPGFKLPKGWRPALCDYNIHTGRWK